MIKEVYLFTNRNCLVFDENGDQMEDFQKAINCYDLDREKAMQVSGMGEKFYIAKWQEWAHEISRESFQYLLGLRTREMDQKTIETEIANEPR